MDKRRNKNKEIPNNRNESKVCQSDISVTVNSKDGKQKEYTYPQASPSAIIVEDASASTAADIGVQVLQPWREKIGKTVDDIRNDYHLDTIELNFGIVKFTIKKEPPKENTKT